MREMTEGVGCLPALFLSLFLLLAMVASAWITALLLGAG